jgi:energy-coupling factor transporter ATP-binding protein EcfA2
LRSGDIVARMIREITIKGFKSILDQTIALGRVNCFIGANGVGKSNVLEAIGVLGAAANGRVDDEALERRGVRLGLPRLYKTSFKTEAIPPHITLKAFEDGEWDGAYFEVSLLNPLKNPEPAWSFKTETLWATDAAIVSQGVRSEKPNLPRQAGLSALKLVDLRPEDPASKLLRTLQDFAIYCPNTPALRGFGDRHMRLPLGLSGGGLAESFGALRETLDEDTLEDVLGLIDWVSDIETTDSVGELLSPSVARTQSVLKFTDRFMAKDRNTFTAYDASEGALYVLFAALLCLSPQSPNLFAIDNLDQALNPRLIQRLTARLGPWLKQANPTRQLLFTAHNPAVLDGLALEDDEVRLFAVERNSDGHTQIRRIALSPELLKLNADYPLSRLWMMGNLGAVSV